MAPLHLRGEIWVWKCHVSFWHNVLMLDNLFVSKIRIDRPFHKSWQPEFQDLLYKLSCILLYSVSLLHSYRFIYLHCLNYFIYNFHVLWLIIEWWILNFAQYFKMEDFWHFPPAAYLKVTNYVLNSHCYFSFKTFFFGFLRWRTDIMK